MELQWPLILFTTFVAWSAGLFGAQGAAALAGEGRRAQMPALIGSAALLAVGGVAVFFHLEHFERDLQRLRQPHLRHHPGARVRGGRGRAHGGRLRGAAPGRPAATTAPALPKWLAALMIAAAALLVLVTGHSYMMAARPAWDSLLGPLTLLGAACAAGPLTFAAIGAIAGGADGAVAGGAPGAAPARAAGRAVGIAAIVGSAANAALSVAYLAFMAASTASHTAVGYYFDPTHPTAGMVDVSALSPFAAGSLPVAVVAVVAALAPVACAIAGRKTGNWKVWGAAGALCAVAGAVALRMAFYSAGASVYLFY